MYKSILLYVNDFALDTVLQGTLIFVMQSIQHVKLNLIFSLKQF